MGDLPVFFFGFVVGAYSQWSDKEELNGRYKIERTTYLYWSMACIEMWVRISATVFAIENRRSIGVYSFDL